MNNIEKIQNEMAVAVGKKTSKDKKISDMKIYYVLNQFVGHGEFKHFQVKEKYVLSSDLLKEIGFDDRMIRNQLDKSMIKISENEPDGILITIDFLNDWKKTRQGIVEIDKRFYEPTLMQEIHKEIDKRHKLDHKEKLALFLIRVTAELKDDKDHCSAALKGDSSAGKDSAIDTILMHFPPEDNFKLTRGTAAALEDEADTKKCIAFSEINKHRENGANSEITETFKQLAEGGISTLKKDAKTGYKTSIKTNSKQKTLLYGTTETESDEELETRYVCISIKGYADKNKIVINDVLKKARDYNYFLEKSSEQESWIASSIRLLEHDIYVIIPFTEVFEKPILDDDGKEKYFFDYSKDRIKRDAKRLLSITRAIAWLYQKQRKIVEKEGCKFILAEPSDFILAIELFAEFFNLTYHGLDHRLQICYNTIKQLHGKHDGEILTLGYNLTKYKDWVLRHKLQEELGIQSINTIKKRIDALKDFCLIETHYDQSIPKGYLIRGCQQGINRVSLPISMTVIDRLLTPYLTPNIKQIDRDFIHNLEINIQISDKQSVSFEKLTPSNLTPSKTEGVHTEKIYQKCTTCSESESDIFGTDGKPYCYDCANSMKQDGKNIIPEELIT